MAIWPVSQISSATNRYYANVEFKVHQQKIQWHSQHSVHFEIQVRLFAIMQCTLAGNVLSKIVSISLQDFQTWYSIPKGV
jgi:hypothetical protein